MPPLVVTSVHRSISRTRVRFHPDVRRHARASRPQRVALARYARRLAFVALASTQLVLPFATAGAAGAGGGGGAMPWTAPLQVVLNDLSGPTARVLAGLAFCVGGLLWAFTRMEEGGKRFAQVVIGIAVAIGAANIVNALAFTGATL